MLNDDRDDMQPTDLGKERQIRCNIELRDKSGDNYVVVDGATVTVVVSTCVPSLEWQRITNKLHIRPSDRSNIDIRDCMRVSINVSYCLQCPW